MNHHRCRRGSASCLGWVLLMTTTLSIPTTAQAQSAGGPDAEDLFLPALTQRADGRYAAAAASLREILAAHADDDTVVQLAYQHLFTTLFVDPAPAVADELAASIREALNRFPALVPGAEYCPREVTALVQAVRTQMYGSLQISRPEGADIILDGQVQGISPLLLEFVRVGDRQLTVSKDGFQERQETITIEPGARLSRDVELSARSHTAWYVAGGTAAGILLWVLLAGGDDAATPLAEPPPPPTAR